MAELLLSHGADPAANGSWGTPLHEAAGANSEEILALLIKKGVDVNQRAQSDWKPGRGKTPLHEAAGFGSAKAVAFLLRHGAGVFIRYDEYDYGSGTKQFYKTEERTALHDAARNGHAEAAKLLLENGADVNASSGSKHHGATPLEMAMFRYRWSFGVGKVNPSLAVQDVLSQYGADIPVSLLETAASKRDVEAVKWLLEHGANANGGLSDSHSISGRKSSVLKTAEATPRSQERAETITLLKEYGAKGGHRFVFIALALAAGGLLILLRLLT